MGRAGLSQAVVLASLVREIVSIVVGAAVLPHGDFCYDPSLVNGTGGSVELHDAAQRVGAGIGHLRPDLLVLTTPHGMALERDFALYENSNGSGFASIGQDLHDPKYPQYRVNESRALAANESTVLALALLRAGENVTGLLNFADSEPAALRWGEVVPLSFLPKVPTLVWSMPKRRYTEDVPMVPELLRLGARLFDRYEASPLRVVVVISSDLAHTHRPDGPYGFSAAAAPFDQAVGEWAATLAPGPLLDRCASLVDRALSCGFTGLVLLHGLLERGGGVGSFEPRVLANHAPTYYGMMVANFTRRLPTELNRVKHLRGAR